MDSPQPRSPETSARIFISYSRKDMAFVDRLEAALRSRGFEPRIDRAEIYAFEDWWKRIQALIEGADTVVFVLSPDAVKSDVALKEVTHAAALNKRFAPIVCRRVDDGAVPEPLRRLNFIFFDDPARFEANADVLAEALLTDITWIRRHTEFGEAARRWAGTGRTSGLLLRPPVLEEAEYWITYRPHGAPPPTAEIQAFVAESRKAETAAKGRRRLAQGLIYTLLVGIIAGLVGWINQAYIKERINWYYTMRPYMVAQVRPYVLTAEAERRLKPMDSFKECAKDCPEMIVVPAGRFTMGSSSREQADAPHPGGTAVNPYATEGPLHEVTIARPFAVSKFAVTFADWNACVSVGGCPAISDAGMGQDTKPVVNVNWDDAGRYLEWFSEMTGKPYRLLSEAEYEYAARAGTQTTYPWGDDIGTRNAVCNGCGSEWDNKQTSPVGSFPPNKFMLYDMVGNVWEWVEDCFHDNYNGAPADGSAWTTGDCVHRVIRGGSWFNDPWFLTTATRVPSARDIRNDNRGFRVARTLRP
jgi:formylglycine-generating enzyme required for sulfatase activity